MTVSKLLGLPVAIGSSPFAVAEVWAKRPTGVVIIVGLPNLFGSALSTSKVRFVRLAVELVESFPLHLELHLRVLLEHLGVTLAE